MATEMVIALGHPKTKDAENSIGFEDLKVYELRGPIAGVNGSCFGRCSPPIPADASRPSVVVPFD